MELSAGARAATSRFPVSSASTPDPARVAFSRDRFADIDWIEIREADFLLTADERMES